MIRPPVPKIRPRVQSLCEFRAVTHHSAQPSDKTAHAVTGHSGHGSAQWHTARHGAQWENHTHGRQSLRGRL